jgi:CspA family cold shock protein
MATGQIKRLVRDRGFGFIRPDGESQDIFFHTTAVQGMSFDELSEGQNVEFDKENDPRDSSRSRAVNIRIAG